MRRIDTDALRAALEAENRSWAVPGVALGVVRGPETHTVAIGRASIEGDDAVLGRTIFQIGSLSKTFKATLMHALVDDGLLSLGERAAHYLPTAGLRDGDIADRLTVHHLLTHTVGIDGDDFGDYGCDAGAYLRGAHAFARRDSFAPPGRVWSYCNIGFSLLGAIVQRATGRDFEDVMRDRVLAPLGMLETFYFARDAISYPRAVGHVRDQAALRVARTYGLPRWLNPAGGLISSVAELAAYVRFRLGTDGGDAAPVLRAATRRSMQAPAVRASSFAEAWSAGWQVFRLEPRVLGHLGSTNGFESSLTMVPDQDFGVVVLTNASSGDGLHRRITEWALSEYCDIEPRAPRRSVPQREAVEPLLGAYTQGLFDATLLWSAGELILDAVYKVPYTGRRVPYERMRLAQVGGHDFVIEGGPFRGLTVDFVSVPGDDQPRLRFLGRLLTRA
jgi:CubicO group peptidase (beta-lactamase class C family)